MNPWICPKCGTVWAPWVTMCTIPHLMTSGTFTGCTCGMTAVCPIHGKAANVVTS